MAKKGFSEINGDSIEYRSRLVFLI